MELVRLNNVLFATGLVWTPPVSRHPGRKALLAALAACWGEAL